MLYCGDLIVADGPATGLIAYILRMTLDLYSLHFSSEMSLDYSHPVWQ